MKNWLIQNKHSGRHTQYTKLSGQVTATLGNNHYDHHQEFLNIEPMMQLRNFGQLDVTNNRPPASETPGNIYPRYR